MRWGWQAAATLLAGLFAAALLGAAAGGAQDGSVAAYAVEGDAIPASLTGKAGNAARGRDIALGRERGNCFVCHMLPAADERMHGDVGPSLKGVAGRLSEGQMRLRLVDGRRLNPASMMPSYHRVDGLERVAKAYAGKPVLTAEEIEDTIAFLMTLR